MKSISNTDKAEPFLRSIGACLEARKWVAHRTLSQCWNECERADWLLWLAGKMADKPHWPTHKQVVLAACECAESVMHLVSPGEDRPRWCIKTVREWVSGTASLNDVNVSRTDADADADAATDADADADANAAAAYIVAYAIDADAATAADVAAAAVDAAAYAAAAVSVVAYAAARKKRHLKLCRVVRGMLHIPDNVL